MFNFLNFLAIS